MKRLLTALLLCLGHFATADNLPVLTPAWHTDVIFEQPESVIFEAKRNILFVSNVNGQATETNGKGYLSQLSLDGKLIKQHWVKGLDAPKGMAIVGNVLYVADITQLVEIDISKGTIIRKHPAKAAVFLNDVAADNEGNIYVSDMVTTQRK